MAHGTRATRLGALALLAAVALCGELTAQPTAPLPSWTDGAAKHAIVAFVERVTTPGSPEYVAPVDRIATFDNDGTLWPEQPLAQVEFALARLRTLAERDPRLAHRQPFKAALEGDLASLVQSGEQAVLEILGTTHGNMPQDAFDAEARAFFRTAWHPRFGVPYARLAYRPMVELLEYLRSRAFTTFVCSGGGIDFIRVISQELYGIPPRQVIGSSIRKKLVERDGRWLLWRTAEVGAISDKEGKPVQIDLHVGQRPLLAAGNVRSGGDIAMLRYSQGRVGPSFQLLIDHDDANREFVYGERDDASLTAARAGGWTVVSMKHDWRAIFDPAIPGAQAKRKP